MKLNYSYYILLVFYLCEYIFEICYFTYGRVVGKHIEHRD